MSRLTSHMYSSPPPPRRGAIENLVGRRVGRTIVPLNLSWALALAMAIRSLISEHPRARQSVVLYAKSACTHAFWVVHHALHVLDIPPTLAVAVAPCFNVAD